MLNISDDYKERIKNNLMYNTLEIIFPHNDIETITQENMSSESMKLKQSICDDSSLKFGGCIASEFNIDLVNTLDRSFDSSLVGKWITVRLTQTFASNTILYPSANLYPGDDLYPGYERADSQEFYIFSGYIDSAKVNKSDNNVRSIVAYDALSIFYNTPFSNRLYELLPCTISDLLQATINAVTLGERGVYHLPYYHSTIRLLYRNVVINTDTVRLLDYSPLRNDDWKENSDTITAGEVLKNVCELVGAFGYIKPDENIGTLNIISPTQNTNITSDITAYKSAQTETYDFFEEFYAEEYEHSAYTSVLINAAEGKTTTFDSWDTDIVDNNSGNTKEYDMTENILAWYYSDSIYGNYKSVEDLFENHTLEMLNDVTYTPLTATLDCRLWVEVGDTVEIMYYVTDVEGAYIYDDDGNPQTETFKSIVLSRTITGIQALTDEIEAKGEQ